ncbi:TetR family transcriptional regulator [Jiangella asiatica]|uniref:TetR/AcrR family transcriptional regulator n=1 Tax=Jiangella asiatica TaxID=2530372 RepID=A0A4R5DGC2_9ACTN|nr:TetR family transcriptional regulator [Jiangella asiatica]TDE10864.1 TetR/AcrR family transcriptional regulator [Jiangella asiatica]
MGRTQARGRSGRRRGAPDTRGEILAAARAEFGERGYDGATMRGIARAAAVDPALVHHYFGTKEKLFLAAMEIPFDPVIISERIADTTSTMGIGERAIRTFLGVWGDPVGRAPILAMLRSAMRHEAAATLLRQFITRVVLGRVLVAFESMPDGALRAEAMVSHLVGLAIVRYVVKLEPIASVSDEELIALVAPVLQRYFDGGLPPSPG